MNAPRRVTPQFRSRKLQALDFIRLHFARTGASPSLSEIAAELGVSTKRAQVLVRKLSDEAQIRVIRGKARGIRLISAAQQLSAAEALLQLTAAGWTVGEGNTIIGPGNGGPFMKKGLPGIPVLHHPGPGKPGMGMTDGQEDC